jgi:hypothetical protein
LKGTSEEEKNDCIIIVFIAEIEDRGFVENLIKELKEKYLPEKTINILYIKLIVSVCVHLL